MVVRPPWSILFAYLTPAAEKGCKRYLKIHLLLRRVRDSMAAVLAQA
jgi:hypothetical protein